jgi:hypothetical protein
MTLLIMNLFNNYWKPTPKKWRKIGDGLLGAAGVLLYFADKYHLFETHPHLLMAALISCLIGKFLTNFKS